MNACPSFRFAIATIACFHLQVSLAAENSQTDSPRTLFDFESRRTTGNWRTVNDGVMGGRSDGRVRIVDDRLIFYGDLSLANNGGFASVRSQPQSLRLQDSDALVIRVKGDGRKYFFNLRTPSNRIAFSYRVRIDTKAGQWQRFRVPVSMFRATSFGRVVPNSGPIDAASVNSLGFMIADKKTGPFKLEVDSIRIDSASQLSAARR